MSGLIIDLFAGGGGASTGIEAALGRTVDIAINHSEIALKVHQANHPGTLHLTSDIWEVKPKEATGGRPVDLLWASPDCTHFSVAKGGKPRKQNIRSLAWAVVRWAADVRPNVIALENVAEFRGWGPLTKEDKPDKTRMGQTFMRWKKRLENLGYVVDFRVLDASHYGAPTRRRRLFLIARRDGLPIVWPEPTHGPGRKPFRTAAECIDWSLACPSIFARKKDLADKTLWRIAQGIKRFVIENPKPFIVKMKGHAHSSPGSDPVPTITAQGPGLGIAVPHLTKFQENGVGKPLSDPMDTVMAGAPRFGLVTPIIAGVGGRAGQSEATAGDAPVGTITAKNDRALIAPTLVEMNHSNAPRTVNEPLGTVTTQGNRFNVVAPSLIKVNHSGIEARGESIESPLTTVTAARRGHAVVAPSLIQVGYGEREGQAARALDIEQPLGTIVAGGQKHAQVAAFLSRSFGEQPGKWKGAGSADIEAPTPTITTQDHNNLAAVTLASFRGTAGQNAADSVDEPLRAVAAGGTHVAKVYTFLLKYYGTAVGQEAGDPLATVTAKDRLGLVTVDGVDYQIVDIGMRMLEPHELLAAQFGKYATRYDLSFARTKAAKVRLIGNSVCPEVAEAVIRANFERVAEVAA